MSNKTLSLSILKAFLDEVQDSQSPASAAFFVIGLMAGEIAKQTGSEHFMGVLRMIVAIDEQYPDRRSQDHAKIAELTDQLEAKYKAIVEQQQ
jgi:hypothetical protein